MVWDFKPRQPPKSRQHWRHLLTSQYLEMLRRSHPSVEQTRATVFDVEAEGVGWGDEEGERTPAIRMKLHFLPVCLLVPWH
jgi:hypothetical protein